MAERGWTLEQVQPLSTDSSPPLHYQPTPHRHFPINRLDLGAGTENPFQPTPHLHFTPPSPSLKPCPTLSDPYQPPQVQASIEQRKPDFAAYVAPQVRLI